MQPANDLVSIVMPCHNRVDLLRPTLESLSQQTYHYIELLIIDDGSSEDVKEVVDSIDWPDSISVSYQQLNPSRGPGAAREWGRQKAAGGYICFLDSDDLWHPEFIAKLCEELKRNPEDGMCYCDIGLFRDADLSTVHKARVRPPGVEPMKRLLPINLSRYDFIPSACMWTREATCKTGPWQNFAVASSEDMEYAVRAGCHGVTVSFVPETLCYYRLKPLHSKVDMASRVKRLCTDVQNFSIMYDVLKKHNRLRDGSSRKSLALISVRTGTRLLLSGERHCARRAMMLAARIRPPLVLQGVAWVGVVVSSLFSPEFAGRVIRHIDISFLRKMYTGSSINWEL